MAPLNNARYEKFALAVFKGKSFTDAAIEAGSKERSAYEMGHRYARRPDIKKRIRELQHKSSSNKVMSVRERKERLSEIARARVTDFVACEDGKAHIKVTLETANSGAIQEVTSEQVGDIPVQITKLKLRDPVGAIAELNKMDGAYKPQKVDVTSKGKEIKQSPIFNIVNPDTKVLIESLEHGGRKSSVEPDSDISPEPAGIPQSAKETGTK